MRRAVAAILAAALAVSASPPVAVAHSDDPSFEGCHSAELNGPQHCHYKEDDELSDGWLIAGGVLLLVWLVTNYSSGSAFDEQKEWEPPPLTFTKVGSTYGLTWTTQF